MTTLTVIICRLIVIAAVVFIIFFIVSHRDRDVLDALSTRAKQIDPLTGVQMSEHQGNYDTPETMVLVVLTVLINLFGYILSRMK